MSNHRSSTGGRLYPPDRHYRYRVEYVSTDGRQLVFGETNEADGSVPLAMACRAQFVRPGTARVVANQTAAPLVRRAAA